MNFQKLADSYHSLTCIVSVEKTENEGFGDIRIIAGNSKFTELMEHPTYSVQGSSPADAPRKFVPGGLYDKYIPKNPNFEDLCFRAAVNKEPIHTYVHPNKLDTWFNVFTMPINYEEGSLCYCTYTMEPCKVSDIDLASPYSVKTLEDVVKTCIKLHDANDFKQTMDEVIKDIRIICGAEVCTLMLVDQSSGTCEVLSTSLRKGSTIKRVTQFVNFYDIANSWLDTIGESDCIIIKDEKDMKYISEINNMWYLTLDEAGVDSVVLFPLIYNKEVLGFIWATNFDTRNTMRIKETLELTTFFLSSEIASYKLLKRLEFLSYTDMLTGIRNRNAMNNKISSIVAGETELASPYGIIFADLNGLKKENDTKGHSAGDILLKKAAILLQEQAGGDDIYRAGGDEFMIIVQGCSEDDFRRIVERIKDNSSDPDSVCFAVGCCFDAEGGDIRDAMRRADENMYKDKAVYYSTYPERKHR
jgi:diguanylate cyclase (GGDEF)-like protein